ncbi:hypothetical protein ACJX0J_037178, partial [Zea mays]
MECITLAVLYVYRKSTAKDTLAVALGFSSTWYQEASLYTWYNCTRRNTIEKISLEISIIMSFSPQFISKTEDKVILRMADWTTLMHKEGVDGTLEKLEVTTTFIAIASLTEMVIPEKDDAIAEAASDDDEDDGILSPSKPSHIEFGKYTLKAEDLMMKASVPFSGLAPVIGYHTNTRDLVQKYKEDQLMISFKLMKAKIERMSLLSVTWKK